MQRTIRATGRGNMTIAPDTTRIMISVEKIYADYETTVKKSAEHTGQLREAIAQAGLDPKDLKTASFNINLEYEGYRDDNDDWRRRFVGYKYEHAMNIEFPIDNEVLSDIINHNGIKYEYPESYPAFKAFKEELSERKKEIDENYVDVIWHTENNGYGECEPEEGEQTEWEFKFHK